MVTAMDDSKLSELRQLMGQHNKLVYEAVKAGLVAELSPEESGHWRARWPSTCTSSMFTMPWSLLTCARASRTKLR